MTIDQNFRFFSKQFAVRTTAALATFISVYFISCLQLPSGKFYNSSALANSLDEGNPDNIKILKLGVPPFRQDAPENIDTEPSLVNLTLLSATPNNITDDDAWFKDNNLALPTYQVPNPFRQTLGNIPDRLPKTFRGNILVKAIRYPDKEYLIYGKNFGENRYLLVYDLAKNQITNGYDFSNYTFSSSYQSSDRAYIKQTLNWVIAEDNIIYFSHSHNTYAESSNGMNAYLTALDLDTNQIIWRSKPLVCNASNFVIINSVIICGYGFTAEADYLYLIDKYTGNILQQIKLKTAPGYIIPQGDRLYVRTYDTDYVFNIRR